MTERPSSSVIASPASIWLESDPGPDGRVGFWGPLPICVAVVAPNRVGGGRGGNRTSSSQIPNYRNVAPDALSRPASTATKKRTSINQPATPTGEACVTRGVLAYGRLQGSGPESEVPPPHSGPGPYLAVASASSSGGRFKARRPVQVQR